MSSRGPRRRALLSACAVALAIAGCGGNSSSGGDNTSSKAFSGGSKVKAQTYDKQVPLAKQTVGILSVAQGDPGAALLASSAQEAMKTLGWDSVVVDGGGDPSKMAAGITQLVNRKVDAILLDAVDPVVVAGQLKAAQAADIPVVLYGGSGSTEKGISASVVPDDAKLATLATDAMAEGIGDKGDIAVMTTDGVTFAGNRTKQLKVDLQRHPGVKIAATHQVDFAKFDTDLQTATKSVLQAHPEVKAIYATISPYPAPIAASLRQLGKTSAVKVFGFYAYPSELDLIRKGQLEATADTSFPQNAYQAVDILAQFFGKKTPFSQLSTPKLALKYQVIDKGNAPANGKAVQAPVDFVDYYTQSWNNAFKLDAAR